MKVNLPTNIHKYKDVLAPTIKSLTDLVQILKGIVPTLVLLRVINQHYYCYTMTGIAPGAQWEMVKLVIGSTDVCVTRYNTILQLCGANSDGVPLHEFATTAANSVWVDQDLPRTGGLEHTYFMFNVPAEGYSNYKITNTQGFDIPCSEITVMSGII